VQFSSFSKKIQASIYISKETYFNHLKRGIRNALTNCIKQLFLNVQLCAI